MRKSRTGKNCLLSFKSDIHKKRVNRRVQHQAKTQLQHQGSHRKTKFHKQVHRKPILHSLGSRQMEQDSEDQTIRIQQEKQNTIRRRGDNENGEQDAETVKKRRRKTIFRPRRHRFKRRLRSRRHKTRKTQTKETTQKNTKERDGDNPPNRRRRVCSSRLSRRPSYRNGRPTSLSRDACRAFRFRSLHPLKESSCIHKFLLNRRYISPLHICMQYPHRKHVSQNSRKHILLFSRWFFAPL